MCLPVQKAKIGRDLHYVQPKNHQKYHKNFCYEINTRVFPDDLGCLRIFLKRRESYHEAPGHVLRNFGFDQFSTNFGVMKKSVLIKEIRSGNRIDTTNAFLDSL